MGQINGYSVEKGRRGRGLNPRVNCRDLNVEVLDKVFCGRVRPCSGRQEEHKVMSLGEIGFHQGTDIFRALWCRVGQAIPLRCVLVISMSTDGDA